LDGTIACFTTLVVEKPHIFVKFWIQLNWLKIWLIRRSTNVTANENGVVFDEIGRRVEIGVFIKYGIAPAMIYFFKRIVKL
jgi:hypothetical protein